MEANERYIEACLEANTHLLTVDGLFAGFAFAGALQILSFENMSALHMSALVCLIASTLLFAFRITIAIRLVWTIHMHRPQLVAGESKKFAFLLHLGRNVETIAIAFFWGSLAPLSFQSHWALGVLITALILLSFAFYGKIVSLWNLLNDELEH